MCSGGWQEDSFLGLICLWMMALKDLARVIN